MGPMGPAGFRRRGRRRGLAVGMAAGAAMSNRGNKQQDDSASQPPAQSDMTKQLEELQNLKNQGVITEAEFEAKKKQILGI